MSEEPPKFAVPAPKFNETPSNTDATIYTPHDDAPRSDQLRSSSSSNNAAKAAAIRAAHAARDAAPAQRERIIMQAAAQSLSQQKDQQQQQSSTYHPPSWAATTTTTIPPYTFEVIKNGTLIETIDLQSLCNNKQSPPPPQSTSGGGYITLGRAPTNDILLDHPSSSRLHAILQFRQDDGLIFFFDPGATHGNFINKKKVPQREYIPMNVGDQLRCGESTRVYCLCGPSELMIEEGPSREQKRQMAALDAMNKRKEREVEIAKAQMARALSQGNHHHRGIDNHNSDDDSIDMNEVNDWRVYASSHELTEKQQKLVDKIRKKERRITFLQQEIEKISNKQRAMEEMTVGQATTLARNEQEVDKAMAEIDEYEDLLLESIRDSIAGKKKVQLHGDVMKRKKRRTDSDEDEDDGDGDGDDDVFYDRTGEHGGGGLKRKKGIKRKNEQVEDAASLYGKLELLKEERKNVERKILLEEEQERKKGSIDNNNNNTTTNDTNNTTTTNNDDDALDAFMSTVDASIQTQRCTDLHKQLDELQHNIQETERLLHIADPDGYYKPGSHIAQVAVDRAKQAQHEVEQKKREEEERKAKKMREEEEERMKMLHEEMAVGVDGGDDNGGDMRRNKKVVVMNDNNNSHQIHYNNNNNDDDNTAAKEQHQRRRSEIEAALYAMKSNKQHQSTTTTAAADNNNNNNNNNTALNSVMEDLAVLRRNNNTTITTANDINNSSGFDEDAWEPPKDQSGDGRTSLNDKLGY